MAEIIDFAAVQAARDRLERLFADKPGLRVPTVTDLEDAMGYLYNVEQIAFIAQVTPATVRVWLRDGQLEGGRMPGRGKGRPAWRVSDAQLRAFFEGSGIDTPELPSPEDVDRRRGAE
jgi:hypothetical protein